jgi:hypothetical protein
MSEHDIHERSGGLFAPDTMLASQYFDRVRRRKDLTGEQRLMCAVIEDAVDAYLKHAATARPDHRDRFSEAEAWIESNDRSWLYAFETICDYLGLDAGYLRNGLRRWKIRARGEAAAAAPGGEVADAPERRRASNE